MSGVTAAAEAVLADCFPVAFGPSQVRLRGGGWMSHDEWIAHVVAALVAANLLAQDTADPADGLSDDEWNAICRAAGEEHSEDDCDALKVAVERILAARHPTAPPEDRVTAAVEALAEQWAADVARGRAANPAGHQALSTHESDLLELRAAIAAAREDNGGAGVS